MGPVEDGSASAQAPGPPAVLSQFERDALWLDQLRWGLDHLQHRQEIAGQLAFGILAAQGVFLTIIGALIGTGGGWEAIAYGIALVVTAIGVIINFQAVIPQDAKTINPERYKPYWSAELAQGTSKVRTAAMFVEEMLCFGSGETSVHEELRLLLVRRYTRMKRAIIWTAAGVGIVVVTQVYAAVGQFISFKGA